MLFNEAKLMATQAKFTKYGNIEPFSSKTSNVN